MPNATPPAAAGSRYRRNRRNGWRRLSTKSSKACKGGAQYGCQQAAQRLQQAASKGTCRSSQPDQCVFHQEPYGIQKITERSLQSLVDNKRLPSFFMVNRADRPTD